MATWTLDELKEAVKTSYSIAQVLVALGLKPAGGNYASIKRNIAKHGLDTAHFTGQAWSAGRKIGPRRPLDDYLSNNAPISSHSLRLKLIAAGVKEARCEVCRLSDWFGNPIPLELDHIDGDHDNNNLDNLRILCPNCHALTPTYRGKNVGRAA